MTTTGGPQAIKSRPRQVTRRDFVRGAAIALILFFALRQFNFRGCEPKRYLHYQEVALATSFGDNVTTTNENQLPRPDPRYSFCSRFNSPSTAFLWKHLKNVTLNASYFPETDGLSKKKKFQEWVDQLYSFYTPERLRKSISSRASTSAMRKIIQILSDYPETKQPLRVMVSGGSVTFGNNCGSTPNAIPGGTTGNTQWEPCSWPSRLEHLWNHMLFGGEPVVNVSNIAAPGSDSGVNAIVLEYQLFPKDQPMPHIVLLAHSANDGQPPIVNNEPFYTDMQDIVLAAHKLRYCDPDLPLIVMVDDFYGHEIPSRALEHTGRVAAIASWFQLMSINYADVVRHEIHSRYFFGSRMEPLMGSNYNIHMGMGFHIGMSLTVMFNFLNELVEVCYEDEASGLGTSESFSDWWPEMSGVLKLEEMSRQGVPSKYIGGLKRESTPRSIAGEWKNRVHEKASRCRKAHASMEPGRVCEYVWMSNRGTNVHWPQDIDRELRPVLVQSNGWAAKGYPIRNPRTGYYAEEEKATFSLRIPVSQIQTNFFTIVIMQSYGPKFVGTNLTMHIRVERSSGASAYQATYEVSGYHAIESSIHVPHKFPIPGKGAQVNDTIHFDATLTSGAYFKIYGVAFCKY